MRLLAPAMLILILAAFALPLASADPEAPDAPDVPGRPEVVEDALERVRDARACIGGAQIGGSSRAGGIPDLCYEIIMLVIECDH